MSATKYPPQVIRQVIRKLRQTTAKKIEQDPFYPNECHNAWHYFELCRPWEEMIREHMDDLRKKGKKTVYVDVCGRAHGEDIGADINYSFSLEGKNRFYMGPDVVFIQGDFFKSKDWNGFINLLRSKNHQPSFVTFVPRTGLQSYLPFKKDGQSYEDVFNQKLASNLRRLVEVLQPGGFILIEHPLPFVGLVDSFMQKSFEESSVYLPVKKMADDNRCSIRHNNDYTTPLFLLRNRRKK